MRVDRRRVVTQRQKVGFARMSTTETERWICESCGFIYDQEEGDPDGGIPPGTAFADIPDSWFCPVCGARKKDFVLYED
jgi:rubredoxin